MADGHTKHAVDEVLDSQTVRKKPQYLVKWTGYTDATCNKAQYMAGLDSVEGFHKRYPQKPGPCLFKFHRSSP